MSATQISTTKEFMADAPTAKMPGHWLLARLGKRVLRPGGRQLSQWLVSRLEIAPDDDVVELAPGFGMTAQLLLKHGPRHYLGVERDPEAAKAAKANINSAVARVVVGRAEQTGLPDTSASAVMVEAMLSMQPDAQKERIAREIWRILKPGGRLAMHELCIVRDDISPADRQQIYEDLSRAIHVGAKPLTAADWRHLLAANGLEVVMEKHAPMKLLEPWRLINDEGVLGTLRIAKNSICDREARQRVREMRAAFRRHRHQLAAVALVARRVD